MTIKTIVSQLLMIFISVDFANQNHRGAKWTDLPCTTHCNYWDWTQLIEKCASSLKISPVLSTVCPLAKVIHDNFGTMEGLMTTFHIMNDTQKASLGSCGMMPKEKGCYR